MLYLLILLLLFFLSYFYDVRGKSKNKGFWFGVIQVILILFAGLRFRVGTDTLNYVSDFYYEYPTLNDFSFEDYPIGKDPLYALINSLILTVGGKFYWVQLIQSYFVIVLVFNYIKKHTSYIFTSAFFYYILCYGQYNFEIMRGSMSIAICLYALDYAIEKKWIKAYFLLFIATLFHVQTIVIFLVPFLLFMRFNRKGMLLLLFACLAGYFIQHRFGDYLELLSLDTTGSKATFYAAKDEYTHKNWNLNFMIVFIFPLLLYTLYSLFYTNKYTMSKRVLIIQPLVMIGLLFLMIQMSVPICLRFVDYFRVHFVIYLSELFVGMACLTPHKDIKKAYLKILLVFMPFFFLTGYSIYKDNFTRFYPYYSVLNRTIDAKRENECSNPLKYQANINEY